MRSGALSAWKSFSTIRHLEPQGAKRIDCIIINKSVG
jgi:hypothetical protein